MIFFVSDLVFKSRIREVVGDSARFLKGIDDLLGEQNLADEIIVVDLAFKKSDPLLLIEKARENLPAASIIAFGAHVAPEALAQAKARGASEVMANSGFVKWLEMNRQKSIEQRGAGVWTTLIFGAIFGAGIWYLFHLIPVYYKYYELENAFHSITRVSKELDDKEFRRRLITQMKSIGTPGDYDALVIDRSGEEVRLQYQYGEKIILPFGKDPYVLQRFFFTFDVRDQPQA